MPVDNPDLSSAAWIVVHRLSGSSSKWRTFRVRIDGIARGDVSESATLRIPVSAGHHDVTFRIDWSGSRPVSLQLSPGDAVDIFCRIRDNGAWYAFFNFHNAIEVSLEPIRQKAGRSVREQLIRLVSGVALMVIVAFVVALMSLPIFVTMIVTPIVLLVAVILPLPTVLTRGNGDTGPPQDNSRVAE